MIIFSRLYLQFFILKILKNNILILIYFFPRKNEREQQAIVETKRLVEELRRNLEIERITTSQAITDLISYIRKEEKDDPMINPPKDNPFQPGIKICKLL